jgi:nicotinamide-nucleotide amidase
MVKDSVRPYLLKETGESDSVVDFLVMGKGESEFEEYLSSFFNKYPKIKIASYPGGGQIRYEIRSNPQDRDEYQLALLDFRNLMAEYIISDNGEGIEEVIIKLLKKKQWRISICESCTGGMLSSMLVNVPGASKVFEEGFITYSNNSKMKYLGVKEETIREHGVVSSPVVLEMIEGLKKLNQADVLIGVSGIAGPGGGSLRKPVGLVHYGIMVKNESISEAKVFKGNREQIRKKACLWILYRLFLLIKDR